MKSRTVAIATLFSIILLLAACAPNSVINPASISQMEQQSREYPQRDYLISPGDNLDIKFMNNPEFNELNVPVRPDGRISLVLAPELKAAGLTPGQLREELIQKYSSETKKPDVTVIIRNFRTRRSLLTERLRFPDLSN